MIPINSFAEYIAAQKMSYHLQEKIEKIKNSNSDFDIEKENRELTELNKRIVKYNASLKKQR